MSSGAGKNTGWILYRFRATKSDDLRTFTLYTDYIEAIISGQFTVAELPTAIEDFQQYYFCFFRGPYHS